MRKREILRIIDANFNRLREALRVCEDVTRFIIEDKGLTLRLKRIRHEASAGLAGSKKLRYASLVMSRDAEKDIGKHTILQELKRDNPFDILSANTERAKESARVLEEFLKVIDNSSAVKFKNIRFRIYNIEKALIKKLRARA